MNPYNDGYMKQVAHSLYLLGRYSSAMKAYDEAQKLGYEQWEIHHNKVRKRKVAAHTMLYMHFFLERNFGGRRVQGQCYLQLSQYENAVQCFQRANQLQAHERTYMSLGKAYTLMEQYNEAIEVYRESLEMSPDNAEVLTSIGLLYLRLGETYRAFDYLGNALTHDPRDTSAILAAGSVIQARFSLLLLPLRFFLVSCWRCDAESMMCRTIRTWMWLSSSTEWRQREIRIRRNCGTTLECASLESRSTRQRSRA